MIIDDDDYDNEHDDEDGVKITDDKDDASSRKLLSSTAASKHGKGLQDVSAREPLSLCKQLTKALNLKRPANSSPVRSCSTAH